MGYRDFWAYEKVKQKYRKYNEIEGTEHKKFTIFVKFGGPVVLIVLGIGRVIYLL